MSTVSETPTASPDDRERWEAEIEVRRREVAVAEHEAQIKDREQRLKSRELRLKIIELRRSRFTNPLLLAIIAATVTALGTAFGTLFTTLKQQDLERIKADSSLFLEVIRTGSQNAKDNLSFLVNAHLINDEARRKQISAYLASEAPIPTLPSLAIATNDKPDQFVYCANPKDVNLSDIATALNKQFPTATLGTLSTPTLALLYLPLAPSKKGRTPTTLSPFNTVPTWSIRLTKVGQFVEANFHAMAIRLDEQHPAFRSLVSDTKRVLEDKLGPNSCEVKDLDDDIQSQLIKDINDMSMTAVRTLR
jgi:hypothetical protein